MSQDNKEKELEKNILNFVDLLIENLISENASTEEIQADQIEISAEIAAKIIELLEEYLGGHTEHLEDLLQQLTYQKLPDENVLSNFDDFQNLLDSTISKGLELYKTKETNQYEIHEFENESSHPIEIEEEIEAETFDQIEPLVEGTELRESEAVKITEDEDIIAEEGLILEDDFLDINETDDLEFQIENSINMDELDEVEIEKTSQEGEATLEIKKKWDIVLQQVFPGTPRVNDFYIGKASFSFYLPDLKLLIDNYLPGKTETVWKEFYSRQNNLTYLNFEADDNSNLRQLTRTLKRNLF